MSEIIEVLVEDMKRHTRRWWIGVPTEHQLAMGSDIVAQRGDNSVGFHLRGSAVYVTYCVDEDSVCFELADPEFFTQFYRYVRALLRWLEDPDGRKANRFRGSKYFRRLRLQTGRLNSGVNMYRS